MICFISHRPWRRLALAMTLLTQAELVELVEELRSMAVAHPTAKGGATVYNPAGRGYKPAVAEDYFPKCHACRQRRRNS
jgi:hypothetical protein